MHDNPLLRFRVNVVRQVLEQTTFYLSAESEEAAEIAADLLVNDGLVTEFVADESQYEYYIELIDPKHDVEPTRTGESGSMVCLVCDQAVEWMGASADDPGTKTGRTIAGPWRHVERTP